VRLTVVGTPEAIEGKLKTSAATKARTTWDFLSRRLIFMR
jgi:hypothetical protein